MARKKNNPRGFDLGRLSKAGFEKKTAVAEADREMREYKERMTKYKSDMFDNAVMEAYREEVSVAEMSRVSGYSRQAIYDILDRLGGRGLIPSYHAPERFSFEGYGKLRPHFKDGESFGVHTLSPQDTCLFKYWTAERMNSGVQEWRVQVLDVQGKLNAQQWGALLSGTTADTRLHEELVKYLDSRHPDLADAPTS